MQEYFTVLTDDYRAPVLDGPSSWDGKVLPHTLPAVDLDTSPSGRSWYCAETLAAALRTGGLWWNGRPAAAFAVEPGPDLVRHGDRFRASTLTLVRRVTEAELRAALLEFSGCFGDHRERMAAEQWAWYAALGRPEWDPERVEASLRHALAARGLGSWTLRRFESAWAVQAASGAWNPNAVIVPHPWDVSDGRAGSEARTNWDARVSREVRYTWQSSQTPAAGAALILTFTALCGWVDHPPDLFTLGLRDAYHAGLELVLRTGPQELGWAMADAQPDSAATPNEGTGRPQPPAPLRIPGASQGGSQHFMVLTHDYRSPAPEGAPVWDGKGLPHSFPAFCLETSRAELSGWNCAETLAVALGHGGLWPDGRPAAAFAVEPGPDLIRRVDSRCRASTLTLVRRATEAEVTTAVLDFSRRFGVHGERLAAEQWAWYVALGRPERDPERVEVSLRHALAARGMGSWTLRRFEAPPDVWAARSASVHTPDVWAAGLARDEWIGAEGGAAWHARFAWAAGDHRHRRAFARGLDARDAWMPLAALTVTVAALSRWVRYPPDFLTVGLREAYYAGLEIAVPTGKQELGWAVADQPEPR